MSFATKAKQYIDRMRVEYRAAKQPSEESSTSPAAHPLAGHYAVGLPHNLFGNDKSTTTLWEPRLLALDQDLPARLIRDKSGPKAKQEYHTLVSACHFSATAIAKQEWLAEDLEDELANPDDPTFFDPRVQSAYGSLNTMPPLCDRQFVTYQLTEGLKSRQAQKVLQEDHWHRFAQLFTCKRDVLKREGPLLCSGWCRLRHLLLLSRAGNRCSPLARARLQRAGS